VHLRDPGQARDQDEPRVIGIAHQQQATKRKLGDVHGILRQARVEPEFFGGSIGCHTVSLGLEFLDGSNDKRTHDPAEDGERQQGRHSPSRR
jgi:hypothetical protein